ncbi:MAG: voltage-gated potassium channel [Methanolobus sp.]|jgi:voltage-gated potassium channel|uniref:potassium channel family protein n=1 Tax=unclassified Methanolobus TaxID=2629569 RepID=UPI0025842985|nr:potassium channel protein [Methanolobus sp.]MDK2831072.1 voltage-gated potassium channel [Methanolobus sp.]MDK2938773.1 voltage-gated potassium channel [Methanolobus sp.]
MKRRHLWHKTLLKSFLGALAIIVVYMIIFVEIMIYEGQTEYVNIYDAIYWVITTLTTVGYGDITMASPIGKLYAVFVQLTGIPLVFGILFTLVIIPWMEKKIQSNIPSKASKKLTDHIIICGYNRLIETLIEELKENDIPYILVEEESELVMELLKRNIHAIYGLVSEEETLRNANIKEARFLIANRNDEMNANIVLTARNISDVNIIAIVEDRANKKYLKYAGATSVVSPKELFGRFIGRKAADPFVNRLTGATEFFEGVSIVELPIYPKSPLMGKTMKNAAIREKTGANVVGMWKGGSLTFIIKPDDIIKDNSVLLAIGSNEQLSKLKKLTQSGE